MKAAFGVRFLPDDDLRRLVFFFAAPFFADFREDDLREDFLAAFLPPLFFFAAILSPGW